MQVRDDARSRDEKAMDQFLALRSRVQEWGQRGIYSKEGLVKLVLEDPKLRFKSLVSDAE